MTKQDFDFIEYVDDMFSCSNSIKLYNPIVTNIECLVKARNILVAIDKIEKELAEKIYGHEYRTEYWKAFVDGMEYVYKMIEEYLGDHSDEKPIDKTKKSNMKCGNCSHWNAYGMCDLTEETKNYWNRCKEFEWNSCCDCTECNQYTEGVKNESKTKVKEIKT